MNQERCWEDGLAFRVACVKQVSPLRATTPSSKLAGDPGLRAYTQTAQELPFGTRRAPVEMTVLRLGEGTQIPFGNDNERQRQKLKQKQKLKPRRKQIPSLRQR